MQMTIGECECGRFTVARRWDAAAYFKGNEDRATCLYIVYYTNCYFRYVENGSLKSGYRLVQTIYRLPDIVQHPTRDDVKDN